MSQPKQKPKPADTEKVAEAFKKVNAILHPLSKEQQKRVISAAIIVLGLGDVQLNTQSF